MAKKTRVKFNLAAFREIRRASSTERMLGAKARQIAEACGGEDAGYFAQTSLGSGRARGVVIAGTAAAMRDNATNNTLVSNLDAARRR